MACLQSLRLHNEAPRTGCLEASLAFSVGCHLHPPGWEGARKASLPPVHPTCCPPGFCPWPTSLSHPGPACLPLALSAALGPRHQARRSICGRGGTVTGRCSSVKLHPGVLQKGTPNLPVITDPHSVFAHRQSVCTARSFWGKQK